MTKAEFLENINLTDMPSRGDLFSIDFFVTILDEINKDLQSNEHIKMVYENKLIDNITVSLENNLIIINEEEISFITLSEWFDNELQVLLII